MKNLINITLRLLTFVAMVLPVTNSLADQDSQFTLAPTIQISSGAVQGLVRKYHTTPTQITQDGNASQYRVYEYRGIPYALSPVGERRWALPVPVTSLGAKVFKAYNFGPACPQEARFNLTEASFNEDCLSINVSVPEGTKAGDNLPVFFWIHGGAFVGGSSNLYRLDSLASYGKMVVVSINYRLGALGFMPNPAFQITNSKGTFNGNYGLEDQRLAMQWVQQNIAAFGGDKNNVTIAGESAGAISVCMHLSAPDQVSDLFNKAIVQSASCISNLPTATQASSKVSNYIQNKLNCSFSNQKNNNEVLSCMRSKPVEEILKLQSSYAKANPADRLPFSPVTGDPVSGLINTTVPSSFKYALSNKGIVSVPLLMGGTKEEMTLYVGYYWQDANLGNIPPINNGTIRDWLKNFYPGNPLGNTKESYVDRILVHPRYAAGLNSSDPNVVAKSLGQVLSDFNAGGGIINNCLYLQTSNAILNYSKRYSALIPVYQFEFDDPDALVCGVGIAEPCPPFKMGSVHSSELNYLFPNFSNTSAINAPDLTSTSQKLANRMIAYWSNFALTGNPNTSSLPNWPLYAGQDTKSVMLLKPDQLTPINSDAEHQCTAFWAQPDMYDLKNEPPF